MRSLWFFSDKAGCGTYRAYFPALHLQETKLAEVELCDQTEVAIKGGLRGIDFEFDAFVLQRAIGGPWPAVQAEAQKRGVAVVVELDDDMFTVPRTNPAHEFWGQTRQRKDLLDQLATADGVIVSTEPLAKALAMHVWNHRGTNIRPKIHVCANHLQPAMWGDENLGTVQRFDNKDQIVIGWQGSNTHNTDFKIAAPALFRVAKTYPHVQFRFFGSIPEVMRSLPPDRLQAVKPVDYELYPGTLKFIAFDIGLAPVTPCHFNESKSNVKWLEYSALKIPCVASPSYPYATSITHGQTGLLAATESEWFSCLASLIEDADLRRQIGEAAYADVWTRFSAAACAPAWATALEAAVKVRSLKRKEVVTGG